MNLIQRYQPDLSWFSDLDRFFNPSRIPGSHPTAREAVHEAPDAWILRLDLPGFAKQDVELKVNDHTLHLTGETPADRAFGGKVDRQWKLGARIDKSAIKASLENGVLEVVLPKTDAPEPRSIEIQ